MNKGLKGFTIKDVIFLVATVSCKAGVVPGLMFERFVMFTWKSSMTRDFFVFQFLLPCASLFCWKFSYDKKNNTSPARKRGKRGILTRACCSDVAQLTIFGDVSSLSHSFIPLNLNRAICGAGFSKHRSVAFLKRLINDCT